MKKVKKTPPSKSQSSIASNRNVSRNTALQNEENEAVLNLNFKFDMESGDSLNGQASTWDYTNAKKMAQDSSFKNSLTSVDHKIAAMRSKTILHQAHTNGSNLSEESDISSDADSTSEEEPTFAGDSSSSDEEQQADDNNESSQENDADDVEGEGTDEDRTDLVRDRVLKFKKRQDDFFGDIPDVAVHNTFMEYQLSRAILRAINTLGYTKPTPIQARAIPIALLGRDICGCAITGSGKTAAFIIPIVERLLYRPRRVPQVRVLILAPTRELALQCHSVATKISQFTDIKIGLAIGGMNMKMQESELRQRPDILIATPGRLIDHLLNSPNFNLDHLEVLVIDEADRMLEVGFSEELKEIIRHCPVKRQTMLFSATMTDDIDQLVTISLSKPVRLFVDRSTDIPANLVQEFVRIREKTENNRESILLALCSRSFHEKCIIFTKSKKMAHRLRVMFGLAGLQATELHGDLSQQQRLEALEAFRDKKVNYLFATDLVSRGIDIAGVETIINFHLPKVFSGYVHRIGRTARAGRSGRAISFIGEIDRKVLKEVLKSSSGQVKNRIVQPEVVTKYKIKIEKMEDQIKEILREEKEELEASQAYVEAMKAENLIQHAEEIQSRPAKVWFKQDSKNIGKPNRKRTHETMKAESEEKGTKVDRKKAGKPSDKKFKKKKQ